MFLILCNFFRFCSCGCALHFCLCFLHCVDCAVQGLLIFFGVGWHTSPSGFLVSLMKLAQQKGSGWAETEGSHFVLTTCSIYHFMTPLTGTTENPSSMYGLPKSQFNGQFDVHQCSVVVTFDFHKTKCKRSAKTFPTFGTVDVRSSKLTLDSSYVRRTLYPTHWNGHAIYNYID